MKTCVCGFGSEWSEGIGSEKKYYDCTKDRAEATYERISDMGKDKWIGIGGFFACPICGAMYLRLTKNDAKVDWDKE